MDSNMEPPPESHTPLSSSTPPPNFCAHCGSIWNPSWTDCPTCANRQNHTATLALKNSITVHPLRSALLLYFILLGTTLVTTIIMFFVTGLVDTSSELLTDFVLVIMDTLIILVWCASSWSLIRPLLTRSPGPRWYLAAFGFALVTFPMATLLVTGLVHWFHIEETYYLKPILAAGYGWKTALLLVCIQPAVIEELAFRGLILGALRNVLHDNEAVIVSAVMFMIIHLSILSGPHLLLLGLVLGFLRVRTGSLYPGMLLHFTHNLLALLSEVWEGTSA